jgi:type IV secretory pathway TrbD component
MMRPVRSPALAIACLVAGLALAAPAGGAPLTIGTGHKPGVAVDAAGTAYVAWFGPESTTTSLNFCRLPRGAGACDVRTTIAVPGTTLSRPFVTVDGATVRVVSYRYGLTGARFDEIWQFTSADGGATFDAGHPVGIAPFDEAVRGPGDTLSVTTNAESTGLAVQNVPLDGSTAGTSEAILSADHPYNGTVALAAPGTLVAVFADGSGNAQVRTSAGAYNDAAAWTPPVDIGYADYPRLAGGPSGLFLLSGTQTNALVVRKWNGSTFGAGVKIADVADDAQAHLTQDPAGRLHAVYSRGTAAGVELDYATSDDGARWQSGALVTSANQGIGSLRAAVAPDYLGVAAWETPTGTSSEVRVVAIGPEGGQSPPVPGKSVAVGLASGKVFITSASGKRTRLTGGATIPVGSRVDTRKGRVALTSAATGAGTTTQTAQFYQGTFKVKQSVPKGNRAAALTTDITLTGASRSQCARARGASAAAVSKKKKGPHAVLGKLWGSGKGRFRTNGKYSAATVRGTIWLTEERCDGTLTTVRRGTVSVRDLKRRKTVTVKAGRSYLARR